MFPNTRITELLGIEKPIICGGMVWCSGYKLAAAVSNAGGLGLIGCGSMTPEVFREHIHKCKKATNKPFGVNVPLIYSEVEAIMNIILEEKIPIVVTSAGNPKTWTSKLKSAGCKVLHVVSSAKFAQKAETAGVDAVIAEGFEAGGHNGREETTTMVLIQSVKKSIKCPLVAAGGFGSGSSILAALALGADAVQMGSIFALSEESSGHIDFKNACIKAPEGDTLLVLKKVVPTRLLTNDFREEVIRMENEGASKEELEKFLGWGRAKKGIFDGNLSEGELEIGQICVNVTEIKSVQSIFEDLEKEYQLAVERLKILF